MFDEVKEDLKSGMEGKTYFSTTHCFVLFVIFNLGIKITFSKEYFKTFFK